MKMCLLCKGSNARYILKNCAYLWVPVLDSCSPTLEQLREAVAWIEEQLKHGNVFVHCAVGHGRSATIIAAYLLHVKKVTGVQGAIDFIKEKRPKINLHQGQVSILQEYTKQILCF
jgi:protein-tyrosine phosphatase